MEFFNKLVGLFVNGHYAVGVFAFVFLMIGTFIFNYAKIVNFGDERKRVKLTKIKEALDCEYLSESDKTHLQAALATEHFAITTGIHAEKELREAIVISHKGCSGELRFIHFKRAVPYLRFENGELSIKISKFEKVSFFYNLIVSFLCFSAGVFLFVIIGFLNFESSLMFFKHLGKSLFMCVLGGFLFFETISIFSARHVKEELIKQRDIILKALVAKDLEEIVSSLNSTVFGEYIAKAVAIYNDKKNIQIFNYIRIKKIYF